MAPMLVPTTTGAGLVGRSAETQVLTDLLDGVEDRGAALVLRGDPGIGKSRLLSEGIGLAEQRGMRIVGTRGVKSEAELAFAGWQQLLRPLRAHWTDLPAPHRDALGAALGIGQDRPP